MLDALIGSEYEGVKCLVHAVLHQGVVSSEAGPVYKVYSLIQALLAPA